MEYRVLARKYRPASFADLIGQDVLVRTLSNAIASNRVHHAFLLTGIRGIGKTTTARIIARALNCEQGPTISPCGVCAQCMMLANDRHPDVLEMDAASRTGVEAMRELLETVHYAPSSARTKIYIIDEVHMLSTSAFNALLKTLEEPPPQVKFIFATTEVRKIPVTILSRCQRFDLKRVSPEMLAAHLGSIAEKEHASLTPEALALLAQAAEGSVRDGLSLLDQAIAQTGVVGSAIDEATVRGMLGLADRGQLLSLMEELLQGDVAAVLSRFRAMYAAGADPLLTLQDIMEFTHYVTRIRVAPDAANDLAYAAPEREAAARLAKVATMPVLARLWQMLLKGAAEVRYAPSPASATEMVLLRIAYAADMPTPLEAVQQAQAQKPEAAQPQKKILAAETPAPKTVAPEPAPVALNNYLTSYEEVVALLEKNREALLAGRLRQFASVVSFAPPRMELHMKSAGGREFAAELSEALTRLTAQPWQVIMASAPAGPTLHEQAVTRKEERKQEAAVDPLIASVMAQFPGAEIVDVKETV